jgi:hypothetical protein
MTALFTRIIPLLLVLLLSMEIAARVEDRIRYGTEFFSPYREQAEMIVRDADGVHGRRDARFQKWAMNNLGFRGPNVDSAQGVGTLRVVATGASETFGLYEPEGKEYPRQLEDSLNASLSELECAGTQRVEVLNAAMAGMTLPTVTQDVKRRLSRFAPAVVVYYPTPTQYLADALPAAARPDSSASGPSAPDWRRRLHPRISDRIREQAKGLLPARIQDHLRTRMVARAVAAHPAGWRFEVLPTDRLDAYESDLRTLVGVTRAIGAEPVLATHANAFPPGQQPNERLLHIWERFYPRATGAVILQFDSAAAERTRQVARDSATGFADVLASVGPDGFADDTHFNESGSGEVAGVMKQAIVAATRRAECDVNLAP